MSRRTELLKANSIKNAFERYYAGEWVEYNNDIRGALWCTRCNVKFKDGSEIEAYYTGGHEELVGEFGFLQNVTHVKKQKESGEKL